MLAVRTVHCGGLFNSTIAGETYAYFDLDFFYSVRCTDGKRLEHNPFMMFSQSYVSPNYPRSKLKI